ncbi:MAG: glycosyltransferase [Candidatus Parvarchaeota archaeon]
MIKQSSRDILLLTPGSLLTPSKLKKWKSVSKIIVAVVLPIYVAKYLKTFNKKPLFIYCSTCYPWDTLPAVVLKLITGVSIICVSHDTPMQKAGYQFFRKSEKFGVLKSTIYSIVEKFEEFLLEFVDVPIAVSQYALDFFNPNTVRNRAILSSNGIPSVISENYIGHEREYNIVYIGRVIERKNLENMFRAISLGEFKDKISVLIITNSGEDKVRQLVGKFQIPRSVNLVIKYNASEDEKYALLRKSEISINISYDETFSLSTMESASQGAALLLSDRKFFRDIYKDAAIYVDPYNPEEIRESIMTLLSDRTLLYKMQTKSIQIARNYLNDTIARSDYNKILRKIKHKLESTRDC